MQALVNFVPRIPGVAVHPVFAFLASTQHQDLVHRLILDRTGPIVYVIVAALLFLETGIVVGFFIPGEIATVLGGVIVSQHHANLFLMLAVVWVAATVGNMSGFGIGKLIGPWLLSHRPLKGNPGVEKANRLIAKRGGPAVLVARWIVFVRAVLPGLVGMSEIRFRTFVIYSAIGGVLWGTMWVLIGDAAGASYNTVVSKGTTVSLIVLGVAVVVVGTVFFFRKRHERREMAAIRSEMDVPATSSEVPAD